MFKYRFSKESLKVLEKLNIKTSNLVKRKIKNIGDWLDNKNPLYADIRKLKGEWKGFYRLKIGQIRVIFSIDDKNKILKVHEIGFRGDVYK
jgi:mRNA interferase RelE/StbE